jgi:hypothetical protein
MPMNVLQLEEMRPRGHRWIGCVECALGGAIGVLVTLAIIGFFS